MQMLSHFVNWNVYNGTRNVWVLGFELACLTRCPEGYEPNNGVCTCNLRCEIPCPEGYTCRNGACICDN